MEGNDFTGTLPKFLTLKKLAYLALQNLYLQGTIPDWSHLTNLENIYLQNNILSKLNCVLFFFKVIVTCVFFVYHP